MKPLTILSWNVNGIRAIQKKGVLDLLLSESPEILCLQETKAEQSQLDKNIMEKEGYVSSFVSAEKKGYSGVAIYSKEPPRNISTPFKNTKYEKEGRVIMAEYENFTLINGYFPNGKASKERLTYKLDFYRDFLDFVENLQKTGAKIIICGDVNTAHAEIDLARSKQNEKVSGFLPEERAWIDALLSRGFLDTLREFHKEPNLYSWWDMKTRARDRNIGWRIDYFFVSQNLKKHVKDAFIRSDVFGSDHCPVGIVLESD